jgi:16S rRNA U516 pseudouridylate synthase RsuA-like enzyme
VKLKKILFSALLTLSLVACNEKSVNYEGTYQSEKGTKLVFEKMDNSVNEYKVTYFILNKPTTESAKVKNEKYIYSPSGRLLGEFSGNDFKGSNGTTFSKIE